MKDLFMIAGANGNGFILVQAEDAEKALKMVKEPALVEVGMVSAATQAQLSGEPERVDMDSEIRLAIHLMGIKVLTEALVVAATTSVEAFKDESLKLFCAMDKEYVIAGKDRNDALDIIAAIGDEKGTRNHPDPKAFAEELAAKLAEQETPRGEFERPPKIISRRMVEWYKSLPPPEPPMMPAPQYIM
jgi:hypothetical protein